MSILKKAIDKLKFYFTLKDNKIKCDFCNNSYDMILNTGEVIKHLRNHEQYENDLSSESSQNDMEKYYFIQDNIIKCVFCKQKLCNPWNTCSIVHFHLEEAHEFNEDNFRIWIDENYTSDESDEKVKKCKKCNDVVIENTPILLTKHLRGVHNDAGSDCILESAHPKNLDTFFEKWIWNYFAKDEKNAKCGICVNKKNMQCLANESYKDIEDHIKSTHKDRVLDKKKRYYNEIQEHLIKCNFCDEKFYVEYLINGTMGRHLRDKHGKYYSKSNLDTLSKYLSNNFKSLGFQKSKCNKCKKVLEKMCSINLIHHMNSDNCPISPEIRLICECGKSSNSENLLRSDENIENIPTSSGDPKAGSSKDSDTEVRDVDHDRDSRRKDLKRKSSDPSNPKPGSSHSPDISDDEDRNSGMKRVKYDDNRGSPDESSSSSSSFLKPHKDAGNIAINVPTNVGSTEETYEPNIPTEDIDANVDDLGNISTFEDIDLGSLNPIIGNINMETDQSPHSSNE